MGAVRFVTDFQQDLIGLFLTAATWALVLTIAFLVSLALVRAVERVGARWGHVGVYGGLVLLSAILAICDAHVHILQFLRRVLP